MPAPIIASPLSPNSTGISVETDSPVSTTPHRIRIPQGSPSKQPIRSTDTTETSPSPSTSISSTSINSLHTRRTNTLDATSNLNPNEKPQPGSTSSVNSDSSNIPSFHIPHSERSGQYINSYTNHRPLSRTGSLYPKTDIVPPERQSSLIRSPTASSAMHPAPYRSSYMASKKSGSYGEALTGGSRRRLGNHLPRIASGDGDDSWATQESPVMKETEAIPRLDKRKSLRDRDFNIDLQRRDLTQPGTVDGVAGLPGRLHLKAPNALSNQMPSSRFYGGSWADRQRHLIQAYEYLCHVGEAQQWIEGCLGEELEFGVVEMEDGLRNGVVLAKLVRAFQGESAVRKIYEV